LIWENWYFIFYSNNNIFFNGCCCFCGKNVNWDSFITKPTATIEKPTVNVTLEKPTPENNNETPTVNVSYETPNSDSTPSGNENYFWEA